MSDNFETAMIGLNKWYFSEIRSLVEQYEGEIKNGEIEDEEDLEMKISEMLDSHEFVSYTAKAWAVCLCSSHENAYEEEMGEAPPTVEARALWAMRTDVYEGMGDIVTMLREAREKREAEE